MSIFWTPELLYGVGAVILALVLAWGIFHNRRSRAGKEAADRATRAVYRDPGYDQRNRPG